MLWGLVLQPRGEVGMDQESIRAGTGTAGGGNPVGSGSSARSATAALGRAFRMVLMLLVVASCSRRAQRPIVETLSHRVVRSLVRVSRTSLPLLVLDPWPPCPCVSKPDPLAPRWALLSALPPVGPLRHVVIFRVFSCLPCLKSVSAVCSWIASSGAAYLPLSFLSDSVVPLEMPLHVSPK